MRAANLLGAGGPRTILSACLGLLCFHATLMAQSVVLTWSPSTDPDVVGYKIYSGTVSQNYTNVVVVGNATNATISGLAYGTTYYFAATTYDDSGNESPYSNEATFSVPRPASFSATALSLPTLNVISNVVVTENAAVQTINLSGITMSGSAVNIITPQMMSGGGSPTLQITATSSRPGLIPNPVVNYTSPKNTGALAFQPVANACGRAIITVTLNNGQQSNNISTQSFAITILPPTAPAITAQPQSVATAAGNTVYFSVAATGMATLEYQWQFNGKLIPSAIGATLTLTNVTAAQAGNYYVTVSNSSGITNSVAAALAVIPASTAADLTSLIKTGGQFSFVVSGIDGSNYVVQASSDMENWVSLQTNASPFTFVDTNITGFNQRFYRTYQLP
jgi:hypothetical protein